MSVKVINGQAIPNMPWQDKPADCNEVIWRDRNGDVQKIKAITDVPMYHKVAIKEMPKGTDTFLIMLNTLGTAIFGSAV